MLLSFAYPVSDDILLSIMLIGIFIGQRRTNMYSTVLDNVYIAKTIGTLIQLMSCVQFDNQLPESSILITPIMNMDSIIISLASTISDGFGYLP